MEVEEAAPADAATPVSAVRIYLSWQSKKKTWAGAVPAEKAFLPKKLRVALPVGVLDNNEEATLAHGALVKGMVGGKREERLELIKTARQLVRASRLWTEAIQERINAILPADAPKLSFGRGAEDDTYGPPVHGQGRGAARGHGRRRHWPCWTTCARQRTRPRPRRAACWCSGPSACRAACSACPELRAYRDAWAARV
jgi:hypothetical protein